MSGQQNNKSRFSPPACGLPSHGILTRFIVPSINLTYEAALNQIRKLLIYNYATISPVCACCLAGGFYSKIELKLT